MQEVDTFPLVQNRVIERERKHTGRERLLLPHMAFVHISHQGMAAVRSTLNVYDSLHDRSTGAPTCILDAQMADFRYILDYSQNQVILTGESIPKGTRVVVAKGDLQDLQGELVRYNNKYRILVRIDTFGSTMVTIPTSYVRKDR